MPRVFASVIIILSTSVPLAAQDCPATVADVANGVRVAFDDGSASDFRLDLSSRVLTEDWHPVDSPVMRNLLDEGLHLTRVYEFGADGQPGGDTNATYHFETPPPAITGPGQTWDIGYAMTDPSVGELKGRYGGSVGLETRLKIDLCSYRAFPVTMTLKEQDFTNLVQVDFLPSLGLRILRGFGPSLVDLTVVTPVSISGRAKP